MDREELDVETKLRYHRIGSVVLKVGLALLAVLAVYLVLFPMVVWLCLRFEWIEYDPINPLLETIAAPIEWLAKNCQPYETFLNKLSELILP